MSLRHVSILLVGLVGLGACTQLPDFDPVVADSVENAPFPHILPASHLAAQPLGRLDETSEAQLQARADRLARRARQRP